MQIQNEVYMRMTYSPEEKEILRKIDKATEKAITIERLYHQQFPAEILNCIIDAMRRTALSIRDELVES